MSSSKPSLLSKASHLMSQFCCPCTAYVCGLLGTYDIQDFSTSDDDNWMGMDFVAICELIGAHDDKSVWLCGMPIRSERGFLLGDLACD
jgi:hypothetical protein